MYKVTFRSLGEEENVNVEELFIDVNGLKVFEETINHDLMVLNSEIQPSVDEALLHFLKVLLNYP
jgi:hypothetical protein